MFQSAFVAVAQAAGQPQIVFTAVRAERLWDDMFDFEFAENVTLLAEAIAAPVSSLLSHAIGDGAANVAGSHEVSGSISPRRTASRNA